MGNPPSPVDRRAVLQNALAAVEKMQARLDAAERVKREPIAIVGMGCRLPGGVTTPQEYWQLLYEGRHAVREIPADRWDVDTLYDPDPKAPGKMHTRYGGFLDQVDLFDTRFFGISPREATSMDPQQRLLLEVVWEALENAGVPPDQLAGSLTGVFVGITTTDYSKRIDFADPAHSDAYAATGNALNAAAGRISFVLGLQGPCVAMDTACSSSLVAIHLACQSLRTGESNLALAGGVNVILSPEPFILFSKWGMMAPDGRCKAFDAAADGFVRAEGCGVIVLKRLSDALVGGDRILALIRGSAVNQDGRSSGLTVPNGLAQQAAISRALKFAGIDPAQVGYVEAHGTGTSLGDPIEVEALAAVLGKGRAKDQPLLIGSVKTNLGHTEAASGVAGLMKVVLSLQHGELPAHLHLKELNPRIPWEAMPVTVPTSLRPWTGIENRRIAGVSSFGFSGTNAHVVLEEAPGVEWKEGKGKRGGEGEAARAERPLHLLTMSAKSEEALKELAGRYAGHLGLHPEEDLADVSYTANVGRAHFGHRLAVTGESAESVGQQLAEVAAGKKAGPEVLSGVAPNPPEIAFLFTGQGSQYVGMGKQLYETQPTFRKALERCEEILRPQLEKPLLEVFYPKAGANSLLDETEYTQPALFALEYGLAELWKSWGIEPSVVMGHSVGEYVAACVAGLFSLEDGLKLIATRGRLMQGLGAGGQMVAVFSDESRVRQAIASYGKSVSIAAINGPENVVISGAGEAVQEVVRRLEGEKIKTQRLVVSHAFHSPLIEPMLEEFERVAGELRYREPRVGLVSNVTGEVYDWRMVIEEGRLKEQGGSTVDNRPLRSPSGYWRGHVREAVQFKKGMETLAGQNCQVYLEIGPSPVLLGMGRRCVSEGKGEWLPSLRKGREDWQQMLDSLGRLYVHGARVDWVGFDRDYDRRKVSLPTYPFQRQRYWFEPSRPESSERKKKSGGGSEAGGGHPLLGERVRVAATKNMIFERRLSLDSPAFLADHQIFGMVVFPGAAYLEMGLAAACEFLGGREGSVEDIEIQEALILNPGETRILQTIVTEEGSFQIFSIPDTNQESWSLHTTGRVRNRKENSERALSLDEVRRRCQEEIDAASYYQRIQDHGVEYGERFQGIERLWRCDGEAFGEITLCEAAVDERAAYRIHPGLLDSCFQLLGAALPSFKEMDGKRNVYIPVGLEHFQLESRVGSRFYGHAQIRPVGEKSSEMFYADLLLLNEVGQLLGEVVGLRLRHASRGALRSGAGKEMNDWLYEMIWEERDREEVTGVDREGYWLILADKDGLGRALALQMQGQGEHCWLVCPGQEYRMDGPGEMILNPGDRKGFQRLFEEGRQNDFGACKGIVHLWSLDAGSASDLEESQILSCASLLHLVQEATGGREVPAPRLWVVTRGAQVVVGGETVAVRQAPVWGLCRVVALEHPELQCVRIDLDPAGQTDETRVLLEEIESGSREDQVSFRQQQRRVARLARCQDSSGREAQKEEAEENPVRLEISSRGILDNLRLQPFARRPPGRDEVEIRVRATGLNFRDVLNAMGMYAGDPGPLGSECAGEIAAVGEGVEGLGVGDEVVALASDSFATYVTTNARFVLPKPVSLNMAEVATIPITFLTAAYALKELGNLRRGERVLIHSAAGGVGLAAVQLAQQAGAEIFATAGSPKKREYLTSLGVDQVMDSRSLNFSNEILKLTGGQGVHMVLNSLTGEFIPKSLAALKRNGRFLEIGRAGIWDPEQMVQSRPDVAYSVIYLGEVINSNPALIRLMFERLVRALRDGSLKPLPLTKFDLQEAPKAFRYMAQARHIGKVVLMQPSKVGQAYGIRSELKRAASGSGAHLLDSESTYLITGGLGGLGLAVAKWMVNQGARHLMLVGRSTPGDSAMQALADLQRAGVRVVATQCDVSCQEDISRILSEIELSLPPLRGIVHTAGVLEDGVLQQQSWKRFARVLAPKAQGAWYLHAMTLGLPLDFFVCFSSASALLGSTGQGNYCAANAFLDSLAHYRRALGLPALSINWGPWNRAGMAAALDPRDQQRMRNMGVGSIEPAEGIQMLERLMRGSRAQVAVFPMNWRKWGKVNPQLRQMPFLSHVIEEDTEAPPGMGRGGGLSRRELLEAHPEVRHRMLRDYLRYSLAAVLGLATRSLDVSEPITNFGLDSIMAVELRNRIELDLGLIVPMVKFLQGPSVELLTGQLQEELETTGGPTVVAGGNSEVDLLAASAEQLLARLPSLADDQVDALLSKMMTEEKE